MVPSPNALTVPPATVVSASPLPRDPVLVQYRNPVPFFLLATAIPWAFWFAAAWVSRQPDPSRLWISVLGLAGDCPTLYGSWPITDLPRVTSARTGTGRSATVHRNRFKEGSSITMAIVAHTHQFVIGVDTHARNHAVSILACPVGQVVDDAVFPATAAGLSRAVSWVGRRTGGDADTLWVIEGTGTYGARLARTAADAGYAVVEAPRMNARANRGIGKSDPLDARRIAHAALPLGTSALRQPRADDGVRAAVRVLLASRDHMSTERVATINALTALLRVTDLGIDARHPVTVSQITTIAAWRNRREEDLATSTARWEATRLAKRVAALDNGLSEITKRITALLRDSPARALLDEPGIGPITAAVAFTAWSHLGRIRSEAAFASLAGVNPIPASSGNTVQHRLNRGGDRRLNRALHMAVVTRMRMHPPTRAYVERRISEGRSLRHIRRCLKRYLARQIYRQLNAAATTEVGT